MVVDGVRLSVGGWSYKVVVVVVSPGELPRPSDVGMPLRRAFQSVSEPVQPPSVLEM